MKHCRFNHFKQLSFSHGPSQIFFISPKFLEEKSI